jgi:hypothetical protein
MFFDISVIIAEISPLAYKNTNQHNEQRSALLKPRQRAKIKKEGIIPKNGSLNIYKRAPALPGEPEKTKKDARKTNILFCYRRLAESNRRIKVLQTSPLPLG